MYATSVEIEGYRSIAGPATLRLGPGMTCVTGANGSGKTNFVRAVKFVLDANSTSSQDESDILWHGTDGKPVESCAVSVTLSDGDTHRKFTRRLERASKNGPVESVFQIDDIDTDMEQYQKVVADVLKAPASLCMLDENAVDCIMHSPETILSMCSDRVDAEAMLQTADGIFYELTNNSLELPSRDAAGWNDLVCVMARGKMPFTVLPSGDRAKVAAALILGAIQAHGGRMCVLDSIDNRCDAANAEALAAMLREWSKGRQVILATMQRKMMIRAENVYGIVCDTDRRSMFVGGTGTSSNCERPRARRNGRKEGR